MCLPVCRPSVSSRGTTIGSSGGRRVRTSRSRQSPNESRSQRACRKNRWKLVWCFLPTAPAARSTLVTVCRCTHRTHPSQDVLEGRKRWDGEARSERRNQRSERRRQQHVRHRRLPGSCSSSTFRRKALRARSDLNSPAHSAHNHSSVSGRPFGGSSPPKRLPYQINAHFAAAALIPHFSHCSCAIP